MDFVEVLHSIRDELMEGDKEDKRVNNAYSMADECERLEAVYAEVGEWQEAVDAERDRLLGKTGEAVGSRVASRLYLISRVEDAMR